MFDIINYWHFNCLLFTKRFVLFIFLRYMQKSEFKINDVLLILCFINCDFNICVISFHN